MSDSNKKNRMVKICRVCGYPNPPDEEFCLRDDMDLSTVPETPMDESASSSAEEQQSARPASEEEQEVGENRCPDCGSIGTYRNNRCSVCDPAAYSIAWQDERLENITISCERSVFIGRVPPVDASLIRQIEPFHPAVSRMHAELYVDENGRLYMRDMGSRNGTKVNNCPIAPFIPEQLKVGDVVAFSSSLCARIEQN